MPRSFDIAIQHELFPEANEARKTPIVPGRGKTPRRGQQAAGAEAATEPCSLESAADRWAPERPVVIRYHDNRSVILSLKSGKDGSIVLRAHECFRLAPSEVAEAAVRLYLSRESRSERKRLTGIVTQWHHDSAALPSSLRPDELRPGEAHDLRAILHRVNAAWFDRRLDLDITFGDRIARRLMGRHERREPRSLVVINPVLDHPWITSWYLDYLVFHECLHEVVPPVRDGPRLLLHPPEFRVREREHPDHQHAADYERWIMGPAWRALRTEAQRKIRKAAVIEATTLATNTHRTSARRRSIDRGSSTGAP